MPDDQVEDTIETDSLLTAETMAAQEVRERKRLGYSYVFDKDKNDQKASHSADSQKPKTVPKVDDRDTLFECNICLDQASNAVVTLCGHLYCWPCLSKWLKQRKPQSNTCPVCKSAIKKETVIPIYTKDRKDPREAEEDSRPSGQRTEPEPNLWGGNMFGGVGVSFGLFPFFPVLQFGWQQQRLEDGFLSRMFLMIATLILVSIILY